MQQNNWYTWLPLAQYTKNSWPSVTTKKAPFELLMGYTLRVHQPERSTDIPTLRRRLDHIKEARKAAQEAQHKVQETWIKDKPYKPFVLGDKVWLEGTNLKLPANLTQKLSPRQYRPFEVAAIISKSAYRLKLPPTWLLRFKGLKVRCACNSKWRGLYVIWVLPCIAWRDWHPIRV